MIYMHYSMRCPNIFKTADSVRGPNGSLTVGEEEDPCKHCTISTLTGRRGEPGLALARTMNLGSKALQVFSNVREWF